MTTPTQAAKDFVYRFEHESMALHRIQRDWLVKEIAVLLTAAAQVGEQEQLRQFEERTKAAARVDFLATIERCKQVILAMDEMQTVADYAAALDKLKDET